MFFLELFRLFINQNCLKQEEDLVLNLEQTRFLTIRTALN